MATKPLSSFNNYKLKTSLSCRWIISSTVKSITYRIICSYIVVQSLHCVRLCDPMNCSTPGFSDLHYLPEFVQTHVCESVRPFNHLILCGFLLFASIFPSVRVFSNVSALRIRWSKNWSFSISPSNEYSGLISFMIDWFDLIAVQGTLKSLLKHHILKVSVLWHTALWSNSHMTIEKTIALTIQTFVSKVISAF